jgi:hypothetical protein
LALLTAAAAMFGADSAVAQDCTAADADIFSTARRARTIVSDYNEMHRIHRADLARNEAFARETDQELPWRFDLAGIVGTRSTYGFEVCTNEGTKSASVSPIYAGGIFSLDFYNAGFGVEAFALLVSDALKVSPTEEQTRTEDGGFRDPVGLASVNTQETIYGGRLTLHDWGSLVMAGIETHPLTNNAGVDGVVLQLPETPHATDGRMYVGLGSPYGDTSLHLVFAPSDVATDIIELRADAVPLPADVDALLGADARGVVGAAYIDDESQVALDLGLADAFGFLTLVAATEFNPVRLRKVRGRVDWDGGPEIILREENPETGEENAMRLALDLGAFAEVSYFNSRHLEDDTSRDHVWGTAFGATFRPDATILMTQIDFWFGVNRPSELARVSEFVDHWQTGVRVHGRFGL